MQPNAESGSPHSEGSILRPTPVRRAAGLVAIGIAAFVAAAMTSFAVVEAGSAYGAYGAFGAGGFNYSSRSGVHTSHTTSSHQVHTTTSITVTSGGTPPGGWFGAQPRRRNNSGVLDCYGTWIYSTAGASGVGASGCTGNTHSSWTSQGAVRGYTGTDWQIHGTFESPGQNS